MRPHCSFCCSHPGQIVNGWEHTGLNILHVPGKPEECNGCYEVMAPCPFCDKGRELETSMFGDTGYWQGEAPLPAHVQETCRCHERPLGKEASQQRLDDIMGKLKKHLGDGRERSTARIQRQLAESTSVSDLVTRSGAVKLDVMPSTNGKVESGDDEIGTLL